MPSRPSKPKRPRDMNQLAYQIVQAATGEVQPEAEAPEVADTRNPAAVALSRLGASKGGQARAAELSPARSKAVQARWAAVQGAQKKGR